VDQKLDPTLENLVSPWRAGFVHRCYTYRLLPNNVPYAFLFMAITLMSAMSGNITIIKFYMTLRDLLLTSDDVLPRKFYWGTLNSVIVVPILEVRTVRTSKLLAVGNQKVRLRSQ